MNIFTFHPSNLVDNALNNVKENSQSQEWKFCPELKVSHDSPLGHWKQQEAMSKNDAVWTSKACPLNGSSGARCQVGNQSHYSTCLPLASQESLFINYLISSWKHIKLPRLELWNIECPHCFGNEDIPAASFKQMLKFS